VSLRSLLLALHLSGDRRPDDRAVLLNPFRNAWQLVPLVLLAQGASAVVWQLLAPTAISTRYFQLTMALMAVAGVAGIVLHYRGNLEFQLEIDATQSSWDLFRKSSHAKAPPALGARRMTQLGLLGLVYTFRHPALSPGDGPSAPGGVSTMIRTVSSP
jgi:hypothetical protein